MLLKLGKRPIIRGWFSFIPTLFAIAAYAFFFNQTGSEGWAGIWTAVLGVLLGLIALPLGYVIPEFGSIMLSSFANALAIIVLGFYVAPWQLAIWLAASFLGALASGVLACSKDKTAGVIDVMLYEFCLYQAFFWSSFLILIFYEFGRPLKTYGPTIGSLLVFLFLLRLWFLHAKQKLKAKEDEDEASPRKKQRVVRHRN